MKKTTKRLFCIIVFFVLLFLPILAHAETLTLTTYYPAPFGAYDQIRLVPRAPQAGVCAPGTMYVRNDTNVIEYCSLVGGVGTWGPTPGVWLQNGTNVYPATYATALVSIGTTTAASSSPLNVTSISLSETALLDRITNAGSPDYIGNLRLRLEHSPSGAVPDRQANAIAFDIGDGTGTVCRNAATLGGYIMNSATHLGALAFGANRSGVACGTTNLQYDMVLTGDGNVGIGTTSPQDKLVVRTPSSGYGLQVIENTTGNGIALQGFEPALFFNAHWDGAVHRAIGPDYTGAISYNVGGGNMYFWTGDSPGAGNVATLDLRMTIYNNGNVGIGIGTSNPSQKLDVNGQIRVRTANVGLFKVLTDTDGTGSGDWRYPAYAP